MGKRIFLTLAALFVIIPLLDLLTLLAVGSWIGFWPTVVIVLVCGTLGAWLAKNQGLRVLRQVRDDWSSGRLPEQGIMDGVLLLLAAGLLMTPGFLTEGLGLALLAPAVRAPVKRYARSKFEERMQSRLPF